VDTDVAPATPAEAEWVATQRKWGEGWRRFALPGVLTVYLIYVVDSVGQYSQGSGRIWGYAVIAAFALCYLITLAESETASSWRFWTLYGTLGVLFVVELPFAHAAAFVMCVYITMITVGRLGGYAAPIVIALALGALLIPVAIASWHDSLSTSFHDITPIAIPVVALASFAAARVHRGNQALAEARQELARLAAENERARIARDLHDLLGHSLTTITVKAGLARRLGQTDPSRALLEIAEVETLARQSLADVRAAVSNYHEVTLAGELASGRELLRAAGVAADIPRAVEVVDPMHQELFGWAVREGVTNIVRHAHASSCAVRLSPSSVEIVDDGVGGCAGAEAESGRPGNGLVGLRERVAAAGGAVDAGPRLPQGWRLRVSLAPEGRAG
jgi:two-component system, NarL family, sensor histidine kinase DesK